MASDTQRAAKVIYRAAEDLKTELSLDEASFQLVAAQSHRPAREYFLFSALDEIQKAGAMALPRLELLDGETFDPSEATSRVIGEAAMDECSLWQRKLIETLAELINFASTPEDEFFRDFLLLVQLDDVLGAQRDQAHFYACESANYQHQVDELRREIAALETGGLDLSRAWYRGERKALTNPRSGRLFSSFSSRLREALGAASDAEKVALGFSYAPGFGRASKGIHARPGLLRSLRAGDDLAEPQRVVLVIATNVLVRCQKAIDKVPAGPNTTMRESLDANTAAPEILGRGMQGRAVRGDLVIVFGELAEVLEVRAGPLGYESYKVKYLSKPLLEDIPEDWHIAQHVAGLLDLDGMKATIQRRATGGSIDENTAQFMLSLPEDKLREAFREGVVAVWEADIGLKESILEQMQKPKVAQKE